MGATSVAQNREEQEVLFAKVGCVGVITLNRPTALNAVNLTMIREIHQQLLHWENDATVVCVVIEGSGDRAFCAGGDVRSVYLNRLKDDRVATNALFWEEYSLNYYISQFKKPYISLINGFCMGGGMGLSIHGSHRIVNETTIMAMPEALIGFVCDVGASYFLNRCPGYFGYFMGLTGDRISAGDALYAGLATHFVSSARFAALREALLAVKETAAIDQILAKFKEPAPESSLKVHQQLIDDVFSGKTVEEIIKRLSAYNTTVPNQWLVKMQKGSPTSLKVILKLLQKAKRFKINTCLEMEYRVSQWALNNYDFYEGVRALLVDKNNTPSWQPQYLHQISETSVKGYFAPLKGQELQLGRKP